MYYSSSLATLPTTFLLATSHARIQIFTVSISIPDSLFPHFSGPIYTSYPLSQATPLRKAKSINLPPPSPLASASHPIPHLSLSLPLLTLPPTGALTSLLSTAVIGLLGVPNPAAILLALPLLCRICSSACSRVSVALGV